MPKALLICNLGVSTKMLKEKIEQAFAGSDDHFEVIAQPRSCLEDLIDQVDIVLIAPQIAYIKEEIFDICKMKNKKSLVIPFQMYGNMDGNSVVELIRHAMNN